MKTPKIDPLAQIAQCMAATPADHPEAERIHAQAGRLASGSASGSCAYSPTGRHIGQFRFSTICVWCEEDFEPESESANARLIASAPCLLAALEQIAALRDPRGRLEHLYQNQAADIASAAIQKATV